ncbi:MAG: T9SS type A sorting domain-containing protein [bacterium]|nr:T9SS type A sorting domain-containing protein [bacterium]
MRRLVVAFLVLLVMASTLFAQLTAQQARSSAATLANSISSDFQLKAISSINDMISPGVYAVWSVIFYSPSLDTGLAVLVTAGQSIPNYLPGEYLSLLPTIPNNFMNSPTIYNNAANAGGNAFLATHPDASVDMYLTVYEENPTTSVWYVEFYDDFENLLIILNMMTGAVMQVVNAPDVPTTATPQAIQLLPNYPNPFNASTTFSFSLPKEDWVSLKVYDLQGRLVATPVQERMSAGVHQIQWNASGLSSGTYIVRLQVNQHESSRVIHYLK